jgi:hypothetical protein
MIDDAVASVELRGKDIRGRNKGGEAGAGLPSNAGQGSKTRYTAHLSELGLLLVGHDDAWRTKIRKGMK